MLTVRLSYPCAYAHGRHFVVCMAHSASHQRRGFCATAACKHDLGQPQVITRAVAQRDIHTAHVAELEGDAQGTSQGTAWELHASLRRCFARQLLGRMVHAHAARQHGVAHAEAHAQHARRYGLHLAPAPAAPAAWSRMEAAILKHAMQRCNPRDTLYQHLTPPHFSPPPTPGPQGERCLLTPKEMCSRFIDQEINTFVAQLFLAVQQAHTSNPDIPMIKLSRYDLFHAHLFLGTHDVTADCTDWSKTVTSHNTPAEGKEGHDTNPALMQLGLLFHTQEYPQFCEHSFPFQLGWCQAGSDVVHEPHAFNKRNILWYGGTLAALDTGPGSLAHHQLLWPETRPLCTVYESDLGAPLADISFLPPTLPQQDPGLSRHTIHRSLGDYMFVT